MTVIAGGWRPSVIASMMRDDRNPNPSKRRTDRPSSFSRPASSSTDCLANGSKNYWRARFDPLLNATAFHHHGHKPGQGQTISALRVGGSWGRKRQLQKELDSVACEFHALGQLRPSQTERPTALRSCWKTSVGGGRAAKHVLTNPSWIF